MNPLEALTLRVFYSWPMRLFNNRVFLQFRPTFCRAENRSVAGDQALYDILRADWKIEFESCSLAGFAVDPDVSIALLDYAVDSREPEARSLSRRLGSKEGLEDSGSNSSVHSATRIADREHHIAPRWNGKMRVQVAIFEMEI